MTRVVGTAAVDELRDSAYVLNTYTGLYERSTLIELASTNVCLRSQEFDNGSWVWSPTGTTDANAATAPDGTVTADRLNDASNSALRNLTQTFTVADDTTTWALSTCVKQDTAGLLPAIAMTFTDGVTPRYFGGCFDYATAAITAVTSDAAGSTWLAPARTAVASFGNGWYRITITGANLGAGYTSLIVRLYPAGRNGSAGASLTNGGVGGTFFWGAQLENKPYHTSYIATTSASVTRSADTLTIPLATGLQTPRELTLYIKGIERGSIYETSVLPGLASIGGSTDASFLILNQGAAYGAIHRRASDVSSNAAVGPIYGDQYECAANLSAAGAVTFRQSINGAAESVATTSSSNALATSWNANTLYIGSRAGSVGAFAFQSAKIAYGTKTLAEMRALGDMASTVLVLDAGATDAITVACEDAAESEAIDVGSPIRAFAGTERGFTRDQKFQATVTTGFLTDTEKQAIQEKIANRAQLACTGTLFGNDTVTCSFKMTNCQMMQGTPLWRMTLQISEV